MLLASPELADVGDAGLRLGGGDAEPASTEEEEVEVVRERLLEGVLLERPRGGRELALFEQRVN